MNTKSQLLKKLIREEIKRQLNEELTQGQTYMAALPMDNAGKNRVYVKVKYVGPYDDELIVSPLEDVRYMTEMRTSEFSKGKQYKTTAEFMLDENFAPLK